MQKYVILYLGDEFMEFKDRLKLCIDYRQINSLQLSIKTGISRSSICLYLKGERVPKTEQINRLALALDVDMMYLLGLSDSMVKLEYNVHQHLFGEPSEEELLIDELKANITWLNVDELRMLNQMVKTLVKDRK